MHTPHEEADLNLAKLRKNPYPGRALVIGAGENPNSLFQVYWIMGRSAGSRNRKFVLRDDQSGRPIVAVEKAAEDGATVSPEQAKLIFYNAMTETSYDFQGVTFVVSNGSQTDDVSAWKRSPENLLDTLADCRYEPDAPNYTPRITGRISFLQDRTESEILVLARSQFDDSCERSYHGYKKLGLGLGFCVTTYETDGNPLPSFRGSPFLVPLKGKIHDIAEAFWGALNPDNRVALAVKEIHRDVLTSTIVLKGKYAGD